MTKRLPGLALALALGVAAFPAAAADPAPAAFEQSYLLGIGDTLTVTVFGRLDLTGQFPVGPDAAIRLPLLGAVPAAGRTRQQMADEVRERLSRVLNYDTQVTVDVALYQPVFVIGDVVRPGEQIYIPGMTALKAYARAGGTPTIYQAQNNNQAMETAVAERDLRLAQTDLFAWLIRRAALDAALGGSAQLTLPTELEPVKTSPLVAEILARESALIDSDKIALARARELGEKQKEQLDVEIAALQGEKQALVAQNKYIEAELTNMEGLQKKGLTTNQRLIDLQQLKSGLQADEHRLTSFMSRARQAQVQIDMRLQETSDAWRRERQLGRITAAAEIERARARLEGARFQLQSVGQVSIADIAMGRTQLTFQLTRTTRDGTQVMEANGNTPVLPGDVVEIHMRAVEQAEAVPSATPRPPERSSGLPVTPASVR